MNAAYLLLTSAWMAGADAAPAAPAAAAPVVSTGSCCGGGCATADPCANVCRPSLLDRVRARFHRNDCCDPCAAPVVHHRAPVHSCEPACDPCRPRFQVNFHRRNDCCEDACRPSLLDRLRARFHRNDCCDTGCNGGCGAVGTPTSAPATPAAPAAPAEAPKTMPKAGAAFNGGINATVLSVE